MNVTEKFLVDFPDVSVVITHDYNPEEDYDIIIADDDFENSDMIKKLVITEKIMLAVNKLNESSNKTYLKTKDLECENFVSLDSSSNV